LHFFICCYVIVFCGTCHQRSSICEGRGFIARQAPELKPIEKLKYKITTKSPKEFRPPKPLLIANCSRLFQRQALLAAILLLNKAYGNCSALTALNPNKGTITTYLGASFHHKILRDMPKKS